MFAMTGAPRPKIVNEELLTSFELQPQLTALCSGFEQGFVPAAVRDLQYVLSDELPNASLKSSFQTTSAEPTSLNALRVQQS
jgi:hypothetical protein